MQEITIAQFLEELKDDGVILYVTEGKVRTRGPAEAVARWKASMIVRKDELLEYLVAQESKYVDPIKRYDEEEIAEGTSRDPGYWDAEESWSYYNHFVDILQARKRRNTCPTPIPSAEIAYLGRKINLAAGEHDAAKFRQAVDRWFEANLEMLDQAQQGIWKGEIQWAKQSEATALYGRTMRLIEYAYLTLPTDDRPQRHHPEILVIEEEIAECFRDRDFERLQDACFKLTKKWRELGLVVKFK